MVASTFFILLDIDCVDLRNVIYFLSDAGLRKQLEGTGGHFDDMTRHGAGVLCQLCNQPHRHLNIHLRLSDFHVLVIFNVIPKMATFVFGNSHFEIRVYC